MISIALQEIILSTVGLTFGVNLFIMMLKETLSA